MFYEKVFKALNKARVKYLVAGGVAVNLYGIQRTTADLDLIVLLEESNLRRFVSTVKRLKLRSKIPVEIEDFINPKLRKKWREEKNMLVFSLYDPKNPYFLLDIMIEVNIDFNQAFKQKKKIKLGHLSIPVVSIEDLIKLKEVTRRPQDIADVYYLKQIKEGKIK